MRVTVATWNVNSIRARIDVVRRWLEKNEPTVLCMQETKVSNDIFPAEPFQELGYELVINGQKSWNGVAIASKIELEDVSLDLPSGFLPEQKRVVTVTVAGLRIMNVYVPNGSDVEHEKFRQKLHFFDLLEKVAERERNVEPFIMVGDFNVAPEEDDVFDPAALEGTICFHPEERKRISRTIRNGMTDVFRQYNPSGKAFSWWDYRAGGFRRNRGMRLDLILANGMATELVRECSIDLEPRSWERPSDHTPVIAVFELRRE